MATEVLIQGKPTSSQSLDEVAEKYKSEVVPDYSVE